jgi:hypothetical protein
MKTMEAPEQAMTRAWGRGRGEWESGRVGKRRDGEREGTGGGREVVREREKGRGCENESMGGREDERKRGREER